jgi:hypothetical protein
MNIKGGLLGGRWNQWEVGRGKEEGDGEYDECTLNAHMKPI